MSAGEETGEQSTTDKFEDKPPEASKRVEASKPTSSVPEVKPETWRKWTRFILETLREPKDLQALYGKVSAAQISKKRVDSIIAILEEAGLVKVRDGNLSLAGTESVEAGVTVPSLEADKLREELKGKDFEVQGLKDRVAVLEAEVESLKTGIKGVECVFLRPLDVIGHSGQRLFHCVKRRITIGERANICLICEFRPSESKTQT